MNERYLLNWLKKEYRNWEKTNLRLELLAWSKIDFFLVVLSSSNTLGSIRVCCHRAWMVLHIPFHIQRKLPYAFLFSHTSTLSTPLRLLCKNRFLHALSSFHTAAYKQHVSKVIKSRVIESKFEVNRNIQHVLFVPIIHLQLLKVNTLFKLDTDTFHNPSAHGLFCWQAWSTAWFANTLCNGLAWIEDENVWGQNISENQ